MSSSRTPTTAATPHPELLEQLTTLGLHGVASQLDDFIARATKARLSPVELLEELGRVEARERSKRGLERRLSRARIGAFKPVADYDWNWPKRIDRALVERDLRLNFMNEGANVLLLGPHGVGKTMLLKNLAHAAAVAGHTVLYVPAAKMLNDLSAQDSPRGLERRLKHYCSRGLLCIDELGYLSYDNRAADLLFEVISRRHELRRPVALTTNLAFKEWTTVFPNATCTVALVDRLTHRADIIHIQGDSWRRKESKERADRQK